MAYKLNQKQIDLIDEKLPPKFAALKSRYPSTIFNAAIEWSRPKFPQGYIPQQISIYYQDSAPCSSISWGNGQLEKVDIEEIPINPEVIQVRVDGSWAYIQVQGMKILDRTEGVIFPPELTQHELMLRRIIHSISSGKYKNLEQ